MPDVMTTTDVPWLPIPDDDGPVSLNRLGDLQRQLRFPVLMDWSGVQLYSNVAPTCEPPEALAEVCRSVQARCDEFGEACATAMDMIDSIGRAELDRMVYSGAAVDLDAMLRQACQHAAKVASHWRPEHPIDWCGPAGDWADFIPRLEEWMRRAASGGKFAAAELLAPQPIAAASPGDGVDENRASGSESSTDAKGTKLPELGPHDMEAWMASLVPGTKQADIARMLNDKHGTAYTQPRVSEMVTRARSHADASGLAEVANVGGMTGRKQRETQMDPLALERGERRDGRADYLRAKERQNVSDEK